MAFSCLSSERPPPCETSVEPPRRCRRVHSLTWFGEGLGEAHVDTWVEGYAPTCALAVFLFCLPLFAFRFSFLWGMPEEVRTHRAGIFKSEAWCHGSTNAKAAVPRLQCLSCAYPSGPFEELFPCSGSDIFCVSLFQSLTRRAGARQAQMPLEGIGGDLPTTVLVTHGFPSPSAAAASISRLSMAARISCSSFQTRVLLSRALFRRRTASLNSETRFSANIQPPSIMADI